MLVMGLWIAVARLLQPPLTNKYCTGDFLPQVAKGTNYEGRRFSSVLMSIIDKWLLISWHCMSTSCKPEVMAFDEFTSWYKFRILGA